jgi:RimJ/RimL family protein N-acetyltransferase
MFIKISLQEALILEQGGGYFTLTIEILNLTVVTINERAKKLYTKLGFKAFGMEEKALKINGNYYDEEYMALLLK